MPPRFLYLCVVFLAGAVLLSLNTSFLLALDTNQEKLETLRSDKHLRVGEFTYLNTRRKLSANETCSFYVNASTKLNDWWNPANVVVYFFNQSLFEQWRVPPEVRPPGPKYGGNDIWDTVNATSSGYWYLVAYNDPEESEQPVDVSMSLTYPKGKTSSTTIDFFMIIFAIAIVAARWVQRRTQ